MKRAWPFITFLPLLFLLLSGCAEGELMEIENRSIVLGIAIDASDNKKVKVSMQLPFLQGSQQGPGGADAPDVSYEVFTDEGMTIWEALNKLEQQSPTALFFGHMKVIAISEEIAETDLRPTLDFLKRHSEIGNKSILIIVEGNDARQFLMSTPPLVPLPSLYANRFFFSNQKAARYEDIQLFKYTRDSFAISQTAMIPLVRVTDKKIFFDRIAVLKNHKKVFSFQDEEVFFSRLLKHQHAELFPYTASFVHQGETIDISLAKVEMKQNTSFRIKESDEDENPLVNIELDITGVGELVEWDAPEIPFNEEMTRLIERHVSRALEADLHRLITKMQEKNIEPWLMGQRFRGQDKHGFKKVNWEQEGWKNAKLQINLKFALRGTGQLGEYDKIHLDNT